MDWPVIYRRKVRYSDSDAQGIVFNGNYLTYFDDTITDYFEAAGFDWHGPHGVEIVLAHVAIDFSAPARIGDRLATGARVSRIGTTSFTIDLKTWNEDTEATIVSGRQVQVTVDRETFRPVPVPPVLAEAISALQGGLPTAG